MCIIWKYIFPSVCCVVLMTTRPFAKWVEYSLIVQDTGVQSQAESFKKT